MVSEECQRVSKKFTKEDWEAVILANEKISSLTEYGIRTEQTEADGVKISWSNGSKSWGGGFNKVPKHEEITLDANELFLPFSPMRLKRIQACFDDLPLYSFSTEAWTKGEVPQEISALGWAIKQLGRINWEKSQKENK